MGAQGTNECPEGYERIESVAACADAAESNGVPFFGSTLGGLQYPAACFAWSYAVGTTWTGDRRAQHNKPQQRQPSGIWYNPDSTGSPQEQSSPMCRATGVPQITGDAKCIGTWPQYRVCCHVMRLQRTHHHFVCA
jgi:hypothetical protein